MEIVKNLLREFKTKEEYDEVKCQLHKSAISVITESDKDELKYKYKNYFIGTYNVSSTTNETIILGGKPSANEYFDLSQVKKMYIDDIEVTPTSSYTFTTIGEHTVKCEFCELTSCYYMFYKCYDLISLNLSSFDTSKVTTMKYMFSYCSGLTSLDVSNFDTSNVTDMTQMFSACNNLTSLDLSNFDTSNVTSMKYIFGTSDSLPPMKLSFINLNSFNTSAVTTMYGMFYNCSGLTSLDLSNFDTSNVTSMEYMFNRCYSLSTLNVSNFNTSNVTNMTGMFQLCSGLTSLDISSFNTSAVTDMSFMFNNCSGLTSLDVSNFNTSNVTDMTQMFTACDNLTSLDLSSFDTSNVTSMKYMFEECSHLTSLTITSDISKVTSYSSMFSGITTNGELIYNCDYEDAWNNILVTNQSTSNFPTTWTKKCVVEYEFVDLGLPSGTQWATFNVGATKPEEYGLYFAWGETEGYMWDSQNGKILDANGNETTKQFAWADYKFSIDGSESNFSEYNSTDGKTTLELVDDAAYVSDNTCRMPTSGECQELIDNTTSAWTTVNGVSGMTFTSKLYGYTDKSIFIPAAGRVLNGSLGSVGSYGSIWSSSLYSDLLDYARRMYFNSTSVSMSHYFRCLGFSVRPVKK